MKAPHHFFDNLFTNSFLKNFKNKTALALVFSFVLVGVAVSFFQSPVEKVSADLSDDGGQGGLERSGPAGIPPGVPLCGFAWSSNIGWVSFNSKDCDSNQDGIFNDNVPGCPIDNPNNPNDVARPYGVSVDDGGRLNGFAWSSNIGWIKFGCAPGGTDCLSYSNNGLPAGAGRAIIAADDVDGTVDGVRNVQGWFRACAGTTSGDCSNSVPRNDGWDGWVHLKSLHHHLSPGQYAVRFTQSSEFARFSGTSWGDEVVGWLKWAKEPSDTGNSYEVRYCTTPTLAATLTANPYQETVPFNSVLTASSQPTGTNSYEFRCDRDLAWSNSQLSNTFNCNNVYTTEGTYYPAVKITQGPLQAIAEAQVYAEPLEDDGENEISVGCRVEPNPAQINQSMDWTATVNEPGPGPYNYTYTFRFNNNGNSEDELVFTPDPQQTASYTHSRSYSTLGNKSLVVEVTNNNAPGGTVSGTCDPVDASVVVNPTIIEI